MGPGVPPMGPGVAPMGLTMGWGRCWLGTPEPRAAWATRLRWGVVGAAELALGGGTTSAAVPASRGCAVSSPRRRPWRRIRFPIRFRRATGSRSYGRRGRRGQCCCCQIWVTPQGGGAPTSGWIPGRTGSLINPGISDARGRIPDERTRAPRIPASDRIPADQRTRTGQGMTGTERISVIGACRPCCTR